MSCLLRLRKPFVGLHHRKKRQFKSSLTKIHVLHYSVMTGTGFVGYVKFSEEKYCTVLVTNNHVIENFDDVMASRIMFENVFPDHTVTLKGSEISIRHSFKCSPMREVCKLTTWHIVISYSYVT